MFIFNSQNPGKNIAVSKKVHLKLLTCIQYSIYNSSDDGNNVIR